MKMRSRLEHARIQARTLCERYCIEAPPVPVERIVREANIKVQYASLDRDLSGMACIADGVSIIGVNSDHRRVRQRFTLAHELGHIILHPSHILDEVHVDNAILQLEAFAEVNQTEIEANVFASELLMPQFLLQKAVARRVLDLEDDDTIANLAKMFRVTETALRYRLQFK